MRSQFRSEERAKKRKLAEQHAAEATQSKFYLKRPILTFSNSKDFWPKFQIWPTSDLIKTELRQKKVSKDKIRWPDETEVLDLDFIEFGDRQQEESSNSLQENTDRDIEGSGDEELEVKEMEILQRANHAMNLEIPQTVIEPGVFSNWRWVDGALELSNRRTRSQIENPS